MCRGIKAAGAIITQDCFKNPQHFILNSSEIPKVSKYTECVRVNYVERGKGG